MIENVDRRVLSGFRCVDAITQGTIEDPLTVTAAQLVLRRNRSGVVAVMDAPQMAALTSLFLVPDPSTWPPPTNFEVTIQDPSMRYFPRRVNIAVPQPLPTAGASSPATTSTAAPTTTLATSTTTPAPTTTALATAPQVPAITTPQTVVLYPTPASPVAPNWAVVRVSVTSNASTPAALAWAVVQLKSAGVPTINGVTGANGEALLAVPGLGLKLSSSSTGAVKEATTPATITAWFDPGLLTKPRSFIPNPDDILLHLSAPSPQWKSASKSVDLGPGQTVSIALTISI
ncbi:MAG TPA: hypothetical protein VGL22_13525 [Terracidiphilus sp.]